MRLYANRDFVGGLLLAGVGAAFVVGSLGLELGSLTRMGPAFFPLVAGGLTVLLGGIIAVLGVYQEIRIGPADWRPLVCISLAIAAFAQTLLWFGLLPAVIVAVLVAATANRNPSLLGMAGLATFAAVAMWLIFIVILGLPVPVVRGPF